MAELSIDAGDEKPAKSKKILLLGLIGAVVFGLGGFYAAYSGLIPIGSGGAHPTDVTTHGTPANGTNGASQTLTHESFVALTPLTISLGKFSTARHLRFSASLDVTPNAVDEVTNLMPRILDVLNTYLRAIAESEIEDPTSMNRIRAQMLRRVQVVSGKGNVRDLLITEFVLD